MFSSAASVSNATHTTLSLDSSTSFFPNVTELQLNARPLSEHELDCLSEMLQAEGSVRTNREIKEEFRQIRREICRKEGKVLQLCNDITGVLARLEIVKFAGQERRVESLREEVDAAPRKDDERNSRPE